MFLSLNAVILSGNVMKSSIDLCLLRFISETLRVIMDTLGYDD